MGMVNMGTVDSFNRNAGNAVICDDLAIAVFYVDHMWCAVENRCPHRDVPLDDGTVINGEIVCPLHGARFNVKTGAHQNPPATSDLRTYAVRVAGGELFVETEAGAV